MAISGILTQEDPQNQLTDLKTEILELSRTLSSRAKGMAQQFDPAVDEVSYRFGDIAGAARAQAQTLVDTVTERPGTISSIAATAAVLGLVIGYFAGSTFHAPLTSRWR
jgi:hypothetical protein